MTDPAVLSWLNDPWFAMRLGEAAAWRAGWDAAKAQAAGECRALHSASLGRDLVSIGRRAGMADCAVAVEMMEPKQ